MINNFNCYRHLTQWKRLEHYITIYNVFLFLSDVEQITKVYIFFKLNEIHVPYQAIGNFNTPYSFNAFGMVAKIFPLLVYKWNHGKSIRGIIIILSITDS